MNAMTITNTHPMPATDCPRFCEIDHAASWSRLAEGIGKTYTIPHTDGTEAASVTWTLEDVQQAWDEVHGRCHQASIASIPVGGSETLVLDLIRDADEDGTDSLALYIDAQGAVTAEQARTFAAALLAGADRLEAEELRERLMEQAVREIVAAEDGSQQG